MGQHSVYSLFFSLPCCCCSCACLSIFFQTSEHSFFLVQEIFLDQTDAMGNKWNTISETVLNISSKNCPSEIQARSLGRIFAWVDFLFENL